MASRPQLPELDWEAMAAEEILGAFLEAFPGRVSLACSFQKEESVLLDMLFAIAPDARVFALDTHVLFPETYAVWREVERRYGTKVEVYEGPTLARQAADPRRRALGAQARPLLRDPQGRAARPRARRPRRLDHRPPPRPVADPRQRAEGRLGRGARALEGEPARRLGRPALLGLHPRARPALQRAARPRLRLDRLHALHAAGRRPRGPLGRRPTRPSAACTWWRKREQRLRRLAHRASRPPGKSTIAGLVAAELEARGAARRPPRRRRRPQHLTKGLGFSKEDRDTNIARIGWVASRLARAGAAVVVSAISPYEEARQQARALTEEHAPFVEVYVATSLEECERRDPKGLYAKAHAGEIAEFTGVSDPTRSRETPSCALDTEGRTPEESAAVVLAKLEELGLIKDEVARMSADDAPPFTLSHLDELESEAIHIMREVAAERERPVLLFSGGKDSIVLLRLAEKAFRPGGFPFPVMHVDTGHNFPEVIEFRDRRVAELGERLVVASVQESIDKGRVVEQTGPRASRNQLQTTTLLDAIEEHGFDAAMGGARRDEERARAKERIFSFRDDFGQWNPRAQRPELWNLYNGRIRKGEQIRVFPISTGPSSTCGSTSPASSSSCRRSTSPTSARSSAATG